MDLCWSVSFFLMTPLVWSGTPGDRENGPAAAPAATPASIVAVRRTPPVMRRLEAADSGVLRLPVTQGKPEPVKAPDPVPPAPDPAPAVKPKPKPKPELPEDFLLDSGAYCQKKIGRWTLAEARALLGAPVRERPATDDSPAGSGRIYAFRDPTARNREIELDFGGKTVRLRTVYVYPWRMNWADCTKRWGSNASALQANKGRMFYSYLDRRLDVLVGPDGQVISVGLY